MPTLHESESELEAAEVDTAIERCRAEIAAIEALLLAGHPDVEGLCLALSDWSGELRLLKRRLQFLRASVPTSSGTEGGGLYYKAD